MCEVCGRDCGPLMGATKSWRCAGIKSRATVKLNQSLVEWASERAKYDNPGKRKARAVPVRIAERLPQRARFLGLSGGGQTEELIRAARPDLEIVSADTNRALWPALVDHAQRFSYEAVCGSFTKADGLFDLIYLDLTGNSSKASVRLVHRSASMLTMNGWLVVTITPDHEPDWAVSLNRPVTIVSLLAAESNLRAVGAMQYANGHGKLVTLCVFHGRIPTFSNRWSYVLDVYKLDSDMKRRGFWLSARSDIGANGFMFGDKNVRYRADPKNKETLARAAERDAARRKDRLAVDPEYLARQREYRRTYRQRPEVKAKTRAAVAAWQKTERGKDWHRDYRQRRKLAAVSGTTAEAIKD